MMSRNIGNLNSAWTSAALLERILTQLEDIKKILGGAETYPRGTTFTSIIHLQNGQPVTRIDFLASSGYRNIPVGDVINQYGIPVSRLIIYNNGPGKVFFDTNRNFNDTMATTPLEANSSHEPDASIPAISSINMIANGNNAEVIMTAIV